jgi:hypothetical protein
MLVGYLFARNIKKAVMLDGIYTITAITFYFVISHFHEGEPGTISLRKQLTPLFKMVQCIMCWGSQGWNCWLYNEKKTLCIIGFVYRLNTAVICERKIQLERHCGYFSKSNLLSYDSEHYILLVCCKKRERNKKACKKHRGSEKRVES